MANEEMSVMKHSLSMDRREKLKVSGVKKVESFDEGEIVMHTVMGTMVVRGSGLHLDELSVETGDTHVNGHIDSIEYEDSGKEKGGFFAGLFR